jgi:hypothetical protein
MATIAVRACLNYKYESGVIRPNGRGDHGTDRRECFRLLATETGNRVGMPD